MQSSPSIDDQVPPTPEPLAKLAYQTFQQSKNYFGIVHRTLSARVRNLIYPPIDQNTKPIDPELLQRLQKRFDQLIEADWYDAEQGIYPYSLLFDNPWEEFFRYYPAIWLDFSEMWQRVNQKQYQSFSPEIETEGYPSYYVQAFHHQTNGYLSDMSANLYDLQVELLFGGTADAMRRRILAPLRQGIKSTDRMSCGQAAPTRTAPDSVSPHQIRILDVACGTGRTLKMLRAALPQASLFGTDLSPAYLRKANRFLSQNLGELPQLLQANAESLPYLDNYFHGVTSVFLFHELPASARQRVIDECFRITQPGGVFVICDSIQVSDSPEFKPMMENFPVIFHEPYYQHYTTDNLVERLEKAGFTDISTKVHFMSKYWIAHKPA